jgi:uncharacterized protein (UPF0332 family)/predicted nucleotidyltransferase
LSAVRQWRPREESQVTQTAQHTLPAVDLWQVIEEFRVGLRDACASDLRGLVLYGSYARGEEHEESDVDIIVLFKDEESAAAYTSKVNCLARRIFEEHVALVSPMPMSERKYQMGRSPFFINVKREGVFILTEEAAELSGEIQRLMSEAERSLGAAGGLLDDEYFDYATSRAYYAMFYAASAALLTKGLTFSRHSGVVSGFGRHFSSAELLPRQLHLDFDKAQRLRQLGDYSTEPFEQSTAEEVLRDARRFVDAVRGYLEEVL